MCRVTVAGYSQDRLCATEETSSTPFGLHRGVDIPEDFDAKGFVEPYCFGKS